MSRSLSSDSVSILPEGIPFRVIDLKQWVYCPRVFYYHACLPDVRPTTFKMEAGVEAGQQEEEREVRRSLQRYGLHAGRRAFNVSVVSPRWGLRGLVDMVVWPEGEAEIIPVDYKLSRKIGPHFKLQLMAYGLMLEETTGLPARRGFLYLIPHRKAEPVSFNRQMRRKLEIVLGDMERVRASEQMPAPTTHRSKCVTCEFRRFCNDVL
ncbi:MAG: CRISPR-associated protein Cas4 [Chloroflexi bacterium]|nr:CRISPR-associated protein Cas4 [Chloroflexota bacterium]